MALAHMPAAPGLTPAQPRMVSGHQDQATHSGPLGPQLPLHRPRLRTSRPKAPRGRHPVSTPLPPWPPSAWPVATPPAAQARILPLHDADACLPQRVLQGQAQQGPGRPRQDLGDRLLGLLPPQALVLWGGRLHVPGPALASLRPLRPRPGHWPPSLRGQAHAAWPAGAGREDYCPCVQGVKLAPKPAAVTPSGTSRGAGVAVPEATARGPGLGRGRQDGRVRAGRESRRVA